jgi:hypothetical protein
MNPANPNAPSASKEAFSNLAALTASLAASGQERQNDHQIPPAWVQQIEQNCSASLRGAEANLSTSITTEAARNRTRWRKAWAAWAVTSVAWLVLVAVLLTNQHRLLRFHGLEQELTEIQAQVDASKAARATASAQLEETRSTLRKLAQWAPIARFQLVPSQGSPTPFVRIDPRTIQPFQGGTIALPELKQEQ